MQKQEETERLEMALDSISQISTLAQLAFRAYAGLVDKSELLATIKCANEHASQAIELLSDALIALDKPGN